MTTWHIISDERFLLVAHDGNQLIVQMHDGARFGSDGVPTYQLRGMLEAKKPRRFYELNVGAHHPITWSGRCCDNSPCKENAMWRGVVAGVNFHLCRQCSRDSRFSTVQFVKMAAVPIPKRKAKEAA